MVERSPPQVAYDDAHLRVLQLLERQPDRPQRQLALALGVSVGKAHYLLRSLVEKGSVKARNFRQSDRKRGYMYLLTPKGMAQKAALTQDYLQRKLREYDALKAEIERIRNGQAVLPTQTDSLPRR
jgi:EPS-associated MarR family transcriptional regulator